MTDDALIDSVDGYTKTGILRRRAMVDALRKIERDNIPGDIVECGVWRGGNIILARTVCPDRVCWLYDTFSGMTKPGPYDVKRSGGVALDRYNLRPPEGWDAVSIGEVRGYFERFGILDDSKLQFVVGDVCETLKTLVPTQIALLRLDTDWYESTLNELAFLYPLLSPGGVLIVDDYGHWQGARKAVDDYFGGPVLTMIDYTAGMMVKP